VSSIWFNLNRMGNGNEEYLKISKTNGGSYVLPITKYFCTNIGILSRDPVPLRLLNKTLHQTLKSYLFLIYIVVDSHKSKYCVHTLTQRRCMGHFVFVLPNL
jgi:hypothetical protein